MPTAMADLALEALASCACKAALPCAVLRLAAGIEAGDVSRPFDKVPEVAFRILEKKDPASSARRFDDRFEFHSFRPKGVAGRLDGFDPQGQVTPSGKVIGGSPLGARTRGVKLDQETARKADEECGRGFPIREDQSRVEAPTAPLHQSV